MASRRFDGASRGSQLSGGLLALLAFLSAVGPLATDMYLPAFAQIAVDLSAPTSAVQLTLSGFLLGLGVGQLVFGPLSDRWGRRPVLLAALTLFASVSVALVFAPNIAVLIVLRFLQGASGSAGVVLSRAIIADRSRGSATVRALSLLAMMVAVAPLIAPLAGGVLSEVWGWRGVLAVLAVLAVVMWVLAALCIRESLPRVQRHSGGLGHIVRSMGVLLRNPQYLACLIATGASFSALMGYISASPFVAQRLLGMSPTQFSFAFAAGACAMVCGNIVNARLAGRVSAVRMMLMGGVVMAAAAVTLTVVVGAGALQPWVLVVCAFALSGGVALVLPNSAAIALSHADAARGAGSALLGAAQFFGGSAAAPIVGLWGEGTAVPMAVTILVASALALLAIAGVARRG